MGHPPPGASPRGLADGQGGGWGRTGEEVRKRGGTFCIMDPAPRCSQRRGFPGSSLLVFAQREPERRHGRGEMSTGQPEAVVLLDRGACFRALPCPVSQGNAQTEQARRKSMAGSIAEQSRASPGQGGQNGQGVSSIRHDTGVARPTLQGRGRAQSSGRSGFSPRVGHRAQSELC